MSRSVACSCRLFSTTFNSLKKESEIHFLKKIHCVREISGSSWAYFFGFIMGTIITGGGRKLSCYFIYSIGPYFCHNYRSLSAIRQSHHRTPTQHFSPMVSEALNSGGESSKKNNSWSGGGSNKLLPNELSLALWSCHTSAQLLLQWPGIQVMSLVSLRAIC